ncbi:MAG TPA: T9SS type A sorting domain-containing protein, partial [Flavobacteriales bacterium]|nr:T9SS type A sorting domain-containing protein [Flavobacteriales bacterium]
PGPTLTGQPVVRDVFVAKLADEASGIEGTERPRFVLYPDPATDRVLVRGLTGTFTYNVLDEQGRSVMTGGTTGERGVDVSALAKGGYLLCLGPVGQGSVQRLKFVKE